MGSRWPARNDYPDLWRVDQEVRRPIPWRITGIHFLFLCWTVANAHYPVLVILGLLFFLAFVSATRLNQHAIALRSPLLVGFFLAALIIHGGCQQWWIGPVLGSLSKWTLMLGATILTAFNDNAAITYLASLVPGFSDALKYVVMAGAVTGGGLTVIANSPKSSRSIDPRVALWGGRNFAAVLLPRSPGADADRRSSVYVASMRNFYGELARVESTFRDDNLIPSDDLPSRLDMRCAEIHPESRDLFAHISQPACRIHGRESKSRDASIPADIRKKRYCAHIKSF